MPSKRSKDKSNSTEQIAYKFIGYPDRETAEKLTLFCGASRFMWNRFLADSRDFYDIMGTALNPQPADYKDIEGLEWLKGIDSLALTNVQLNFEAAMKAFFEKRSGFPNFKKKGRCRESYKTNVSNLKNPNLYLDGNMLKLPKIKGPVQLDVHRTIKRGGILKNCTVTHENDRWYFSLIFEYPKPERKLPDPNEESFRHIGLDMSLPKLFVDSENHSPEFIKAYAATEQRLAKEQRKLSRMEKGSRNYEEQKKRISELNAKIKRQRQDMLHKISAELTDNYDLISIEDLDISAMKQALNLGKSVSDLGWGNFTRMLSYKQERKGHCLIKVLRWFPSSRKCGKCGNINHDLTLNDRTYVCPVCGNIIDRDWQAACNIDEEGLRLYKEIYQQAA